MRCWRGYLSGARCKWSAYGPADAAAASLSLASLKFRKVLPWCQLTQVVVEKRPLKGCWLERDVKVLLRSQPYQAEMQLWCLFDDCLLDIRGHCYITGWWTCCWCWRYRREHRTARQEVHHDVHHVLLWSVNGWEEPLRQCECCLE